MTDIEKKALALVNEACKSDFKDLGSTYRNNLLDALLRAIEQHEAFRQVVNCEMLEYRKWCKSVGLQFPLLLERFIIAKPDPLVEVLQEISGEGGYDNFDHYAYRLRSALEARDLEIREKQQ